MNEQYEVYDDREEALAGSLSANIDAILGGEPAILIAGTEDEELEELLNLADELSSFDLPPRPEFGPQLKAALLPQASPPANAPSGGFLSNKVWLALMTIVLIGIGLMAVTGVMGTLLFVMLRSDEDTPAISPTGTATTTSIPTLTPTTAFVIDVPTHTPTPPPSPTDTSVPPTATPTPSVTPTPDATEPAVSPSPQIATATPTETPTVAPSPSPTDTVEPSPTFTPKPAGPPPSSFTGGSSDRGNISRTTPAIGEGNGGSNN